MRWSEESNEQQKIIDALFYANAIFNRHKYFTKKLWEKVPGFDDADEADVKAAFMSKILNEKTGIMTAPAGLCWASIRAEEDYEDYENYVNQYNALFDDYAKWCANQR